MINQNDNTLMFQIDFFCSGQKSKRQNKLLRIIKSYKIYFKMGMKQYSN